MAVVARQGPVGQLSADAVKLTWGNLQQAAVGDDMKLGSEAIAFASKYSPNAWPISLFKTAFTDQLRMAADPSYEKNLKRIMRKHETEMVLSIGGVEVKYYQKRYRIIDKKATSDL
jgi:hypothetical protein